VQILVKDGEIMKTDNGNSGNVDTDFFNIINNNNKNISSVNIHYKRTTNNNYKKIISQVVYPPSAKILLLFHLFLVFSVASCKLTGNGDSVSGSGSIEADEIRVSPLVPGRITAIFTNEGESFKKGDVLVSLARDEIDAHLRAAGASVDAVRNAREQAFADFKNASVDLSRIEDLYKSGAASKQNLDQMRTRYQISKSRLSAADAQVRSASASLSAQNTHANETVLRAHSDGTVLSRNFEIGEIVLPGSPVLTVADLSTVTLTIYIPEPDLPDVSPGQKAVVAIDGSDKKFEALVSHISSKAEFTPRNVQTKDDRARLVFAVKLRIPNPDRILKPGMPADGSIIFNNVDNSGKKDKTKRENAVKID
jgi:HlyD family secretion protein